MKPFERINQHAMVWLKEMMTELDTLDADRALHALRAGLQALRDRLSVDEAAQLAAQLPLIVRGLFFEGWDPTGKPLRIRHRGELLALVREKYGRADLGAEEVLRATFRTLERHVSQGEVNHVLLTLPRELLALLAAREDEDRV